LNYLNSLKEYLKLDPRTKDEVIRELEGHIEDRVSELEESGLSEKEARESIVQILGPPKLVAQQIYEVYSQGSWRQSFFAALPHFLIAILFAMQWWHQTFWIATTILLVISTIIYGWCHGRPTWLFPWLGYLLVPVIVIGVLFIYLPGNWTTFAVLAYLPLALFLIVMVARQTLKQDWLFLSLMLLPLPIVLGWAVALNINNPYIVLEQMDETAHWIALSFAALALTVAVFIRLRKRWLKTGALLIPVLLILLLVAIDKSNSMGFLGWFLLTLLTIFIILGPALWVGITRRKHRRENTITQIRLGKYFVNKNV
jgi:hypothetical protein